MAQCIRRVIINSSLMQPRLLDLGRGSQSSALFWQKRPERPGVQPGSQLPVGLIKDLTLSGGRGREVVVDGMCLTRAGHTARIR